MTSDNYGEHPHSNSPGSGQPPAPQPPGFSAPPPPTAAPKKRLGTGAIVAIVIGAVIIVCCCVTGAIAVLGGDDQALPEVVSTGSAAGGEQPAALEPGSSVAPPTSAAPAPPKSTGPPTVKVGQPIDVTESSAISTVTVTEMKKATSDNQFSQPRNGQFVAVMVDIFAKKDATDLGPSNFRLIGADGTVHLAEFLVVGIDPQLSSSTTIQQGQRKKGYVVFDVPAGAIDGFKVEVTNDRSKIGGYWAN